MCACWGAAGGNRGSLWSEMAPQPGKRILLERTPLWKHMNSSRKVAAMNIFRYKKRSLMTVLGIWAARAAAYGLRVVIPY